MAKTTPTRRKPNAQRVEINARVEVATCEMYATYATRCPLCKAGIPAKTKHRCTKELA